MKTSYRQLALAVAIVLAISVLAGCSSTATAVKAETYCFKAVDSTARLVHVGMGAAGDAYRAGLLPEKAKDTLVAAHKTYQPIASTALTGCEVVGTKGDADAIIAKLQSAADDVIRALVMAGVLR